MSLRVSQSGRCVCQCHIAMPAQARSWSVCTRPTRPAWVKLPIPGLTLNHASKQTEKASNTSSSSRLTIGFRPSSGTLELLPGTLPVPSSAPCLGSLVNSQGFLAAEAMVTASKNIDTATARPKRNIFNMAMADTSPPPRFQAIEKHHTTFPAVNSLRLSHLIYIEHLVVGSLSPLKALEMPHEDLEIQGACSATILRIRALPVSYGTQRLFI